MPPYAAGGQLGVRRPDPRRADAARHQPYLSGLPAPSLRQRKRPRELASANPGLRPRAASLNQPGASRHGTPPPTHRRQLPLRPANSQPPGAEAEESRLPLAPPRPLLLAGPRISQPAKRSARPAIEDEVL
ncbi:hypothetical protein GCM10010321_37090 [Streptomyces chartreusis]|nr:hypothetical protein GCM10010321_37090 [Streptomyces chartreusis]